MNATVAALDSDGPAVQTVVRQSAVAIEVRFPGFSKIRRGCCARYEPQALPSQQATDTADHPGPPARGSAHPDPNTTTTQHPQPQTHTKPTSSPSPSHLFGRRWLCDVYPQDAADPWCTRIYIFFRTRNKSETETDFTNWIRSENVKFQLIVTEPDPARLYFSVSSEECWWGICEGFGTWCLSLPVCAGLVNLCQDTLVLRIELGGGHNGNCGVTDTASQHPQQVNTDETGVSVSHDDRSQMRQHSVRQNARRLVDQYRFIAFGPPPKLEAALVAFAIDALIDKPLIGDCEFVSVGSPDVESNRRSVQARADGIGGLIGVRGDGSGTSDVDTNHNTSSWRITAQSSILAARLPTWQTISSQSHNNMVSIPVKNVSCNAMRHFLSFVYTGIMMMPRTSHDLAQMLILSEQFKLDDLALSCCREMYALMTDVDDALVIADRYSSLSQRLLGIVTAFLLLNFKNVRGSVMFRDMVAVSTRNRACLWYALLRGFAVSKLIGSGVRASRVGGRDSAVDGNGVSDHACETPGAHPAIDKTLSAALITLFDNPSVSDIRFVVEGKSVHSQRCFLETISESFRDLLNQPQASTTTNNHGGDGQVVHINGPSYTTFRNTIRFLYTGGIDPELTLIEVCEIHHLATEYHIPRLINVTAIMLTCALTPDTVTTFMFTIAYRHASLRRMVQAYFGKFCGDVCVTRDFGVMVLNPVMHACDVYAVVIQDLLDCVDERPLFHVSVLPELCEAIVEFGDEGDVTMDVGSSC